MNIEFLPTRVDCNMPLRQLLCNAAQSENVMFVDHRLNDAHFKRKVVGIWNVDMTVISLLPEETLDQAKERVEAEGYLVKNLRSLAAFMDQHPEVFREYDMIAAVGNHSHLVLPERKKFWTLKDLVVPAASIAQDGRRTFFLHDVATVPARHHCGILVSAARKSTSTISPKTFNKLHLL